MIGSTSATIIDRADELVTLRALGMLRARLIRLLMGEAAVIGAFGSGLGLVSGALLGGTFVKTVAPAVAGFRFTLRWPIGTMAGLVVASVVAAIGAAGAVARHWTRQPIAIDEPTALA
jgi:putative ABC transport system permease protein